MEILFIFLIIIFIIKNKEKNTKKESKTVGEYKGSFEEERDKKIYSANKYYKRKNEILDNKAEKDLYIMLMNITKNKFVVIPHVSLRELFYNTSKSIEYKKNGDGYLGRFHVDFLICSIYNLAPLMAIELDGKYHDKQEQVLRDSFKDELFRNSELPLLRVKWADCNQERLEKLINEKFAYSKLICEKCGNVMIERENKNDNTKFLGCSKYPKCKHTESDISYRYKLIYDNCQISENIIS